MSSKKLLKHQRLMTYALLTLIITTALSIGVTPQANASQFEWQQPTEQKFGSATAPKINKWSDIPTVSLNTNYKPEQISSSDNKFYQRCITNDVCTLGEFFSNSWNSAKKIFFKITNPNPDLNNNPSIDFLQKPITNPANTNQIKYNIKLPATFPNSVPGSPYNMQRCLVFVEVQPSTLGTSCQGLLWIEGDTVMPSTDYYYSWKNIGFGAVGVLIKSCFTTCAVVASATIDNQGQLPPQFAPEPQPPYETDNEPNRRIRIVLQCKAQNGTITSVTKYSDTYLHTQGKTPPLDLTCPANTRITESKIYEETYNDNTWQNSTNNNINNEPGLIGVATYPVGTTSTTNEDANCVIGQDTCNLDVVKSSPNGAVSCFNNVPLCLDFKTEVTDKIKDGTYNPSTSQYNCVYNSQVKSMNECKSIFPIVEANQSDIGNNTPANTKSIQDLKECIPGGLQILNPYSFVIGLGCVLETLFIPKTNTFYEKVREAYLTETPLPQLVTLVSSFIAPATNAKNTLTANYCQGLDVTIPLEITAWGETPNKSTTVYLFSACDGLLKKVSDLWLPTATGVVYLSGFVIGVNLYLRAWGLSLFFKGGTGMKVNP